MDGLDAETIDDSIPLPRLPRRTASLIVAVLGCFSFYSSLNGEFVFDDTEAVTSNKDLLPQTHISDLFSHDFWGNDIRSKTSHKSYRPLTVLTFRLNYALADGYKPWGFHLFNIILHSINCILVLNLFSIILPRTCLSNEIHASYISKASFLGAILFAVHPIHSESVAGIVGRADLLSCLFFLLAFLSFHWCLEIDANNGSSSKELLCFICTVLFAGLSMFSKEQGATVLGICLIYDIISNFESIKAWSRSVTEPVKTKMKKTILRVLGLSFATCVLLGARFFIMNLSAPSFQPSDNPAAFAPSLLARFLSHNYIYSINVWLLFNPWWLCFDWSMGCIPVITGVTDWRVIFPLSLWIVLILLLLRAIAFFTKGDVVSRNIIHGLCFLVIPFLPASNLLFTVGFVVAERVLYIPSIGFCLLVVLGFTRLLASRKLQTCAKGLCLLLLVTFMARSIQRSTDWLTEEALFTSGENVCPLNAKVHYNIGKTLADKGDGKRAIEYYQTSIRLNPSYDSPLNNLGNLLKDMGRNKEAEMYLERAIKITPSFAAAWMNLGIVKTDMKKFQEAEVCYRNALKFRNPYPDAHYNLGNLYLAVKNMEAAVKAFNEAVIIKPTHGSAWMNKILALGDLGRLEEAVKEGKKALNYLPNDPSLCNHIANLLGKSDKFEESESFFLKAIQNNPLESSYHGNLGVLYHRWRKYNAAERYYLRSIELNPRNHFSVDNYKKLKRAMGKA